MYQALKNQKLNKLLMAVFFIFYIWISPQVFERSLKISKALVSQSNENQTFLSDLTPDVFKIFSFGAWPMMVDWLWMLGLIVDDSLEHVKEGQRAPLFYYADYASSLDPAFFEAMNFGGLLTMIVRDDFRSAEVLLLKGESYRKNTLLKMPKSFQDNYWANSWAIPQNLGYLYMFENMNLPKAQEVFHDASQIEGAPDYFAGISQRLSTTRGQYETGLKILDQVAPRFEGKPELYQKFLAKKESFKIGFFLFELNEKFDAYKLKREKIKKNTPKIFFNSFLQSQGLRGVDPAGGELYVDSLGAIQSRTKRIKVGSLPF